MHDFPETTDKDLRQIADFAHREWLSCIDKETHLLNAACYVKAYQTWLASKGYKIVKND